MPFNPSRSLPARANERGHMVIREKPGTGYAHGRDFPEIRARRVTGSASFA